MDKISVSAVEGPQTNITAIIHVQQGDVDTVRAVVSAVLASGFPLAVGSLVRWLGLRFLLVVAALLVEFRHTPPSSLDAMAPS